MGRGRGLILLTVLVLPAFALWTSTSAEAREYRVGDWIVTGIEQKFDSVIDLRGNLTVKSGGSLTFRNVSLLFNSTVSLRYGVTVESGGELYLLEGTLVGAVDNLVKNRFEVRSGARATIISSTVSEIGTSSANGFRVLSSDVVFQSSTVKNSSVGLHVIAAQPRLTSVTLTANTVGARFENTTAILDKATVTRSVIGADIADSDLTVSGSRFEQNNLGIRSVRSSTKLVSGTVRSNLDGISVDRGTFALEGSTLTLSSLTALRAKNATVYANYSSINQNLDGGRLDDGLFNASFSSFWGNTRDLVLKGGGTVANISDSSLDTKLVGYSQGARLDRFWSLRLRVVSEKGLPVFNASVEVNHTALNFTWKNRTSAQGYSPFVLLFVMEANATNTTWPGPYNLSAAHSGSRAEAAVNVTGTLTRVLVVRSPPLAPVVSVDEIKAFTVRVNWTPYKGPQFERYDVHVSDSSWDPGAPKKNATSAGVTTVIVDRLKPDTEYYAWVKLTLTDGRYAYSLPVGFQTLPEFPYPYNHTGPLQVCSLLVLRNGTWFVNGNVTVCPGGTLRLENSTVVLNSTSPGSTGVLVEGGGSISMAEGRISSRSRFTFSARPGSALDLQDSQVDKVVGGLRVDTDGASFARTRIEDSDDALVILRGTPALRTIILTNVTRGIVATGRDLVVEDFWAFDTPRPIDVSGGALVLRDALFSNCTVGVRARGSEVIAQRVGAGRCATALDVDSSPRTEISELRTLDVGTGLLAANSSLSLDLFEHENTDTALDLRNVTGSVRGLSINGGKRGLVIREGKFDVVSASISKTDTAVSATDAELSVSDPRILDATTGFLAVRSNLTVDSGYVTQQNGPCFDLRDSDSRLYYLQTSGGSHSISQSGGSVEVTGSILGGARIGVESDAVFNASDTRISGTVLYAMSLDGAAATLRQVFLSTGGLAGLKADSSKIWLENSSIAPALRAVTLRKSTLDLLGSSVPGDSVDLDPLSKVRYRWHGTVRVIDHDGAPVAGANVTVEDGANGTYFVKQVTGETGTVAWLRLLVRETNGTRETKFDPFRFRAWLGPSLQERSLNISGNLTVMLALVTPPRPVTLLSVKSENIFEDRVVLEWNSTGPGELAWMETQIRVSGSTKWELKENLTEPVPSKFVIFDLVPSTSYEVRLAVHNRLAMAAFSEVRSFTTKPFNHAPELNEATVPGTVFAGVEFAVSVVYRDQDGDPPKYVAFVANGTHLLAPGEIVGSGTRYSGKVTLDAGKYSAYFEADDNRSSPRSKNLTQRINLVVLQTEPERGLSSTVVAGIAGLALIAIVLIVLFLMRQRGWTPGATGGGVGRGAAASSRERLRRITKPDPVDQEGPTAPRDQAEPTTAESGETGADGREEGDSQEMVEEDGASAAAAAAAAEDVVDPSDSPGHPLHPVVAAQDGPRKLGRKYRRLKEPVRDATGPASGGEKDGGAPPASGA